MTSETRLPTTPASFRGAEFVDPNDILPGGREVDYHERLAALRRRGPFHRLTAEEFTSFPGANDLAMSMHLNGRDYGFVAVGRKSVIDVLRDEASFASAKPPAPPGRPRSVSLSTSDDEEHRRLRSLVAHAFHGKALERWQKDYVRPLVQRLVDDFVSDGRAELNRQFNVEIPVQTIAAILGLPLEDYATFRSWAFDIVLGMADPAKAGAAIGELRDYFVATIQNARETPGENLIGNLVRVRVDGDQLADDEILSATLQMVLAGTETSFRSLGTLEYALLSNPGELESLQADMGLLPNAVDEAIRWESAFALDVRIARADAVMGDHQLREGDVVVTSLASANRDESVYDRPDEFRIEREFPRPPHLGFAIGPHVCIGAPLARMQMAEALDALLARLPNLRLDPDAEPTPTMRGGLFRGPSWLPVVFDA